MLHVDVRYDVGALLPDTIAAAATKTAMMRNAHEYVVKSSSALCSFVLCESFLISTPHCTADMLYLYTFINFSLLYIYGSL